MDLNRENKYSNSPESSIEPEYGRRSLLKLLFSKKIIGLTIFVIVALIVFLIWIFSGGSVGSGQAKLVLWFDVTENVTSGSEIEMSLIYENQGSKGLSDLELEMVFPPGFEFLDSNPESVALLGQRFLLGDLDSGRSKKVVFSGIFSGSPQEVKTVTARMFYKQGNSTAVFSESAEAKINFLAPDFDLRVNATPEVIDSQDVTYEIRFKNISERDVRNLELRLFFPNGFTLKNATPAQTKDGVWEIVDFTRSEERVILVTGTLEGIPRERKILRADLGQTVGSDFTVLTRSSVSTIILDSPIKATHVLSDNSTGVIGFGENLNYKIQYENTGRVGMNNVRIELTLEGEAFDLSSIRVQGGALVGKKVVWNPSGQPALAVLQPGEKGELSLSLDVKDTIAEENLENPVIITKSYIASDELPENILGNSQEVKIRSELTIGAKMNYLLGVNPPKALEETIYEIVFQIDSTSNKLSDLIWLSTLNTPTVDFVESSVVPADEASNFDYNINSGRITWRVGEIDPYGAKQIKFQVRVRPSVVDSKKSLDVVKDINVSGQDLFVDESINAQIQQGIKINQVQ